MVTDDMVSAIPGGYDGGRRKPNMPRGGDRGGRRPLKHGEPTINMAARIPVRLKEKLARRASASSKTITDILIELIEQMPDP